MNIKVEENGSNESKEHGYDQNQLEEEGEEETGEKATSIQLSNPKNSSNRGINEEINDLLGMLLSSKRLITYFYPLLLPCIMGFTYVKIESSS